MTKEPLSGRVAAVRQGPPRTAGHHQGLERGKEEFSPLLVSEPERACGHLDLGLPASRTVRQHISAVLSYQFVVLCLRQPQEAKATSLDNFHGRVKRGQALGAALSGV